MLLAENIIEHTRIYQDARSAISRYYHFESKLMRAIHRHIGYAKECVLIDRTQHICSYRGCGAAVHFKDLMVWGTQYNGNIPYELDYFRLEITVEFEDDDGSVTNNFSIDVPIDLEINFTQGKFDAWITSIAQKKKQQQEQSDREKLKELLAKNPQWGIFLQD